MGITTAVNCVAVPSGRSTSSGRHLSGMGSTGMIAAVSRKGEYVCDIQITNVNTNDAAGVIEVQVREHDHVDGDFAVLADQRVFTADKKITFGALAETAIPHDKLGTLQSNLLRSHAVGFGDALPVPVVRAMLLLRANVLAGGYAGVRPLVIERLLGLLNAGIHPVVPSQGSVGASGDLAPLAHLALPLIGTLDSERTQVVMESLLERIVETGSMIAIIDITGVPTVDTLVAQHLLKTVSAAKLMGAECIISGIRPQIAQTIVHLGIDLGEVSTRASLADALMEGLRRLGTELHPLSGARG